MEYLKGKINELKTKRTGTLQMDNLLADFHCILNW
jgi:hypothetical protein